MTVTLPHEELDDLNLEELSREFNEKYGDTYMCRICRGPIFGDEEEEFSNGDICSCPKPMPMSIKISEVFHHLTKHAEGK